MPFFFNAACENKILTKISEFTVANHKGADPPLTPHSPISFKSDNHGV